MIELLAFGLGAAITGVVGATSYLQWKKTTCARLSKMNIYARTYEERLLKPQLTAENVVVISLLSLAWPVLLPAGLFTAGIYFGGTCLHKEIFGDDNEPEA